MTNITRVVAPHFAVYSGDNSPVQESFDDKVLHFIEQNRPQGSLKELMEQMRSLSIDDTVSLQQLNKALIYSNTYLRNREETKGYTDNVLDKHTSQLIGLNTLYNTMLYKAFTTSDDDTSY